MAIVVDSTSTGGFVPTTNTLTFSHTCTGSNLILFVHATTNVNSDTVTGITYNGVAMTFIDSQVNGADRFEYLYYLINPATGAHNVVVTANTSANSLAGESVSYTGAKQTGQPDNHAKQNVVGGTQTLTLTTVANNCWTVLVTTTSATTPAASTNSTLRIANGTGGGENIFDSNGPITPAGSFGMSITSGSGAVGMIMASFAPVPTNIKTINGLSIGSVKTVNGLGIASMKTFNGLT